MDLILVPRWHILSEELEDPEDARRELSKFQAMFREEDGFDHAAPFEAEVVD